MKSTGLRLSLTYGFIAALATVANLVSQEIAFSLSPLLCPTALSILVGTFTGLVTKYALDKRYIFEYRPQNTREDVSKFILYVGTGILTTAVFWGFELWFDNYFKSKGMRYVGAVIGLVIGYVAKYQLDKRLVFPEKKVLC